MNDCLMTKVPQDPNSRFRREAGFWWPGSPEAVFYNGRLWSAELRQVCFWALTQETTMKFLHDHMSEIEAVYETALRRR